MIFLPGTDKQIKILLDIVDPLDKNILIAGSQGDKIAAKIIPYSPLSVQIITDDSNEMMDMRFRIKDKSVPVKMMDYKNTDFKDGIFDLIYSQGTFSTTARRKIYKESLRILKEDGIICSGEVTSSEDKVPVFVSDVWEKSGIAPLTLDKLLQFYNEAGLEVLEQKDISYTLKEFYNSGKTMLKGFLKEGTEDEKKYYKKLINKVSHEANAYLNLGGDRYMEFHTFILKRKK
jgi:SAM-dependent methyltransferase